MWGGGGAGLLALLAVACVLCRDIDTTSWATALSPPHLAVADADEPLSMHCAFARPPPPGGAFALGMNGRIVHRSTESEIHLVSAGLLGGNWHSTQCLVLDASGDTVFADNRTVVVRQGTAARSADLADVIGDEKTTEWLQHHDEAGSPGEAQPPGPGAGAAACAAGDCAECQIETEGLVWKDTHYPPHASMLLEEHFYRFYVANAAKFPARIQYVPVMWISHMHNMQLYRRTYRPTEDDLVAHILAHYSDPDSRYFAVMQADFWPEKLEAVIPTNWLVFSASCATSGAWPIPLTTQFHPAPPPHLTAPRHGDVGGGAYEKRYLASFVGRDTTWVRHRMREVLAHDPDFLIVTDSFMINADNQQAFRHVTAQSVFVLAPRGNGPTSFRIFEALEHGAIPVYIFDEHCCLPLRDVVDWDEFAVLVPASELAFLPLLLRSFSPSDLVQMRRRGQEVLARYFSLRGTSEYILASLARADAAWADAHAPPLLLPAGHDAMCQRSAVGLAVSRLLEKMREGGAGGMRGEMEAVGQMLMRACVAGRFEVDACMDARVLLQRAAENTTRAGGLGGEGGGHSALAALGVASALLDADPDLATVSMRESIVYPSCIHHVSTVPGAHPDAAIDCARMTLSLNRARRDIFCSPCQSARSGAGRSRGWSGCWGFAVRRWFRCCGIGRKGRQARAVRARSRRVGREVGVRWWSRHL